MEQVSSCPNLRGLISSVIISHTNVNRTIIVQVVKDQKCGLRPQGSVKRDSDARLHKDKMGNQRLFKWHICTIVKEISDNSMIVLYGKWQQTLQ